MIAVNNEYVSKYNCFLVALRIHVSEICRDILEKLGGFHLVYRGQITMKVCLYSFFANNSFTYSPSIVMFNLLAFFG